jgi:hypothetical protein
VAGAGRGRATNAGANNFDQRVPEAQPAGAAPITDDDIPF